MCASATLYSFAFVDYNTMTLSSITKVLYIIYRGADPCV